MEGEFSLEKQEKTKKKTKKICSILNQSNVSLEKGFQ
jgi:hypothetical protein